ncbi:MAG: YggT family protein [Clostridium sp.]
MIIILNFLNVLQWLIIIDAILSWFIPPRSNTFSRIIGIVIDPILMPFRRIQERFSAITIPVDFSPVFAIFALGLLQTILRSLMY